MRCGGTVWDNEFKIYPHTQKWAVQTCQPVMFYTPVFKHRFIPFCNDGYGWETLKYMQMNLPC